MSRMNVNKIIIQISRQMLFLKDDTDHCIAEYAISTAKNGAGEKKDSEKTPRGLHYICEKIGDQLPIFTVFQARKPTGEIFTPRLAAQFPERDWILSRILWLSGMEPNINCGGDVDTRARYIYIHGTHDEKNIGTPQSHGCIRMKNTDMIELFQRVAVCDTVLIE